MPSFNFGNFGVDFLTCIKGIAGRAMEAKEQGDLATKFSDGASLQENWGSTFGEQTKRRRIDLLKVAVGSLSIRLTFLT